MFDVGRICVKTAGREAGRHCVVVNKDKEEGFVIITGPKLATGVRRRRCNIAHLQPLEETIDIKADVSDDELLNLYDKMKFYEKFGVEKRKPFGKAAPKPPKPPEKKPKEEKPKKEEKKKPKKEEKKPEKKKEPKKEKRKEAKPKPKKTAKKEPKKPTKKKAKN